jgi:HEXXH motif-containing protein
MTPALRIATLPCAATALHGAGDEALQEFRNAAALDALARLVGLPRRARNASGVLLEQLEEVGSWLVGRPASQLRGICEQVAFRVWLGDVERALGADTAQLDTLLARLPYVFLRDLPEMGRRVWQASIPASGRASPLGLTYRYRAAFSDVPATIELATIDGNGGVARVVSPHALTRVERKFALLDVEIFDTGDFPELSRLNSENGAELAASAVDPREHLAAAFHFLIEAWPECLPDLMAVFRGVLALDAPGGHTYSASCPTAPLIVQLTLRLKEFPTVLAETIVHETAHLKLHTLHEMEPLLVDDGVPRYHHPWRTDLRPLQGVLLGAHAFLNVAHMYQHAIQNGSNDPFVHREHETRLAEVCEALQTLEEHAQFTDTGRSIFEIMCRAAGYRS